tara:strand:+ start:3401 stop:4423 length:1023 start_codon:yes stop_codon:yes gene_type:complete
VDFYKQLEQEYCNHLGTKRAISVNTGTAALHVAIEALCLPPGSKVIVPDFTMYSSALAVYYARLEPVFVDCDDNLLIDLDKVERAIDKDVKVLMVTHVYGRVVDMSRVMKIAQKYNLRVIEDACEAQGAHHSGKPVGSFDIGCFSFYRNKIICAEEGGIVASNDVRFMKTVEDMKSMSFGDRHDYYHKKIGFNYRMTNSQAKMALQSLARVEQNLKKREKIKDFYNKSIDEIFHMPDNREVCWIYDIRHPASSIVVDRLKKKNIKARHAFKPMSAQPLFKKSKIGGNSLRFSEDVFYIHLDLKKTFKERAYESDIISKVLEEELHEHSDRLAGGTARHEF